ncbi:hypothetical protein FHS15_003822 [Paenibacillus castaneae]|nr:hypothetical protein [Paenibacillus castaneae]
MREKKEYLPKSRAESDLLWDFLELVIRNADAERGIILLEREGKLVVEAEKEINRSRGRPMDIQDLYLLGLFNS